MLTGHQAPALYALFHNASKYTTADKNQPVSHIYSGIVTPTNRGLDVQVYDYDGSGRTIRRGNLDVKFDMAAFVPVEREAVQRLDKVVGQINRLGENGNWPFYFSRDMSILPEREIEGEYAIAPEGHIDPPHKYQNKREYCGKGANLVARINCVRMTFLCARIAGIKIDNIAGLSPFCETGEEIRIVLRRLRDNLVSKLGQRGCTTLLADHFSASSKAGSDKKSSDFILDKSGVGIVTSKQDIRMNTLGAALDRRVDGKTLYEWVASCDSANFREEPMRIPAYLKTALCHG